MTFNSLFDSVLIEIDSIYDDKTTIRNEKGELIDLQLPTDNYSDVTEASKRNTSGRVVSVCKKISKSINNLSYASLRGFPTPIKTYSYTQEAEDKGYPEGRQYTCGGYEDEFVFNTDIQVQEGDWVHFDYLSLNKNSLVKIEGNKEIHQILYKNIFAFVRAEETHVINGWVLAEPEYQEDVEEIEHEGVLTKMQVSKSGIIIDHNPEKKKQEAIVTKIGKDVGFEKRDVELGDNIMFGLNKHKVHIINSKEYYAIKKQNLMACLRNGSFMPYGNYIMVAPVKREEKGNVILSEGYKNEIVRGRIMKLGKECNPSDNLQVGQLIHFIPKSNAKLNLKDKGVFFIKSDYVYAVGEGEVEVVVRNR